jgi:hypothetical protein
MDHVHLYKYAYMCIGMFKVFVVSRTRVNRHISSTLSVHRYL